MEFIDNWYRTAKEVIFNPKYFFRTMPTSGGFGEPLRFALVNMLILSVLSAGFSAHISLIIAPVALIFGTVVLFLAAGLYHLLLKLVGAKNNYEATFRVFAYLSVFDIFMSISYINSFMGIAIGFIIGLYVLYLMIVGLKEVHDISFLRCAIVLLFPVITLIMGTLAIAAVLTAWIGDFTQEHADRSHEFDEKISCAYSNIELDRDHAKWDSANQIFCGFVSNTGVEDVTLTRVEVWIDNKKQLPISLKTGDPALTVDTGNHIEVYVNLGSAFSGGGTTLTKIKFNTQCDPVFDSILQPQAGWTEFTWSGEGLANE